MLLDFFIIPKGISEACEPNECHSISSNDEDEINSNRNANNDDLEEEDDAIPMEGDDLSDFDNFSGRSTPIISGRDTPSSHSHEDLHNTSSSANRQANTLNINNMNPNMNANQSSGNYLNDASVANLNTARNNNVNGVSGGGGNVNVSNSNGNIIDRVNNMNSSRGPQLPITVQKANREDINEKFCKFEINKGE